MIAEWMDTVTFAFEIGGLNFSADTFFWRSRNLNPIVISKNIAVFKIKLLTKKMEG